MRIEDVAAALNGNEYGEEISRQFEAQCRANRIVVVFGASDDLIEFRGAIDDEAGAPGITLLTTGGIPKSQCDDDDCPYWAVERKKIEERGAFIKSVWCPLASDKVPSGISWIYETTIPHTSFDIMEDGEVYCRGIVFRLDDVP